MLSDSVRFLNYSYIKRIYENNIVDYEIYAKLQIKETELNSIVSNYHKRDKEFIPYGLGRMNEYCDWWDLKISDIKQSNGAFISVYLKASSAALNLASATLFAAMTFS